MVSDDHTALAAISIGALTSGALTLAVGLSLLEPEPVHVAEVAEIQSSVTSVTFQARPGPVIDFAIIRGPGWLMAGPEAPRTGWDPPEPMELRLRPSR